ncbi:MAG: DNA alkylation repair protein [Lachnospiraceae bacterium]|nr:DNA alkylation repair protein [Lachnospiraceae bacterium]
MTVYERLLEVKDDTYKEFQSKLVPNIDGETILGVRTPDMRNIAKEVFGTSECERFLKDIPHKYYEENLVHMFLIGRIKNFDECVKATDEFLPYVDCWPVSDQSSPNVFKKNHEKLLPHIKRWIDSDHVYTSRFGIRILMNEFLDSDFKDEYLGLVAAKTGEDYYLKMMVAWYFATALAKQYDASIKYCVGKVLDPWTHKKAIQKAIESYRVTDEHKEYLRSLK